MDGRLDGKPNHLRRRASAHVVVRSDAPLGTILGEALEHGYIGVMKVIDAIRGAMTDPLAQESD